MAPLGSIFVSAALYSVSFVLLFHTGSAAELRVPTCKDGSRAVLERSGIYMGKEANKWTCSATNTSQAGSLTISKLYPLKDFDLCSADCTIYCNNPADNGPNITDCKTLASYYRDAGRFTIDARQYIIWQYDTCQVTQYNRLNHADQRISYCFDQGHWAGVVDRVSAQCGPRANARGGSCYFYDSLHFSIITVEKA